MIPAIKRTIINEVILLSKTLQNYQQWNDQRLVKLWELAHSLACKEALESCTQELARSYDCYTRSLIKSANVPLKLKNKIQGLKIQNALSEMREGFVKRKRMELVDYNKVNNGMNTLQSLAKDLIDG